MSDSIDRIQAEISKSWVDYINHARELKAAFADIKCNTIGVQSRMIGWMLK
jgi:hypothetical protein